jgi:hypothetical protein
LAATWPFTCVEGAVTAHAAKNSGLSRSKGLKDLLGFFMCSFLFSF